MTMLATVLANAGGDGGHAWFPLSLLLLLAIVAVVTWLVARRRGPREPSGSDRARDILAERFARGELNADEYKERLAQLG